MPPRLSESSVFMEKPKALQNQEIKSAVGRPPLCGHCGKPKSENEFLDARCECGRPTKLTDATIQKLKESFALGSSIEEACFYAEIANQTYYNWIEKNPQ